ncbi:G-protein coupled receptor 55-like [Pristis pectinata]|uniref:G-protein coupled receptor 55-like n=1 Tax=Pristis pectinata TaxID=685728 RepID=UPI00223DBB68|nr:G-protein coupled receptor 55-like [Pristis pectinata]
MSDILLLFSLPFKIYAYHAAEWSLGQGFCTFLESLYYVNTYASILMIALICLDRYISITHPFLARSFRSPKQTAISCATVWIFVWSCSACIYLRTLPRSTCFFNHASDVWITSIIAFLQTIFVASALTMIFCSVQIIRTLRKSGALKDENKYNKSVKVVLSNLSTFLVCFTPCHVAMLLYFLARKSLIHERYQVPLRNVLQICLCLANVNCVLDAMYYYFVIREFRMSNKDTLTTVGGTRDSADAGNLQQHTKSWRNSASQAASMGGSGQSTFRVETLHQDWKEGR